MRNTPKKPKVINYLISKSTYSTKMNSIFKSLLDHILSQFYLFKSRRHLCIFILYAYILPILTISTYLFFLCIRWYHVLDENEPTLLETGSGTRVLGQVLSIEAVRPEDAGTYRCSASNDAGQTSAETRLDVVVPLEVQVKFR